jgi:hypothetical protein
MKAFLFKDGKSQAVLDRFERDQALVFSHERLLLTHKPLNEAIVFLEIADRYKQDIVHIAGDIPA